MRESQAVALKAPDAESMRAIGARLARAAATIDAPLVIALHGDLGAGKTTLVGGFVSELGHRGHAKSPTYTLIEPYEVGGRAVFHLDLYRLADPREADALGLRDLLQPRTVLLIEWPERGASLIPPADLWVDIEYGCADGGRVIGLSGRTPTGHSLLRRLEVPDNEN